MTSSVSNILKSIKNKQNWKFVSFDIEYFCPTIFKELLSKWLNFAEAKIPITEVNKKIIYHSRKSLLFEKWNTSMKKRRDLFDVAMGF